ncbi:MAG: metallophosphoesterase [Oscillospiraceae bacterium]|nr:metallophosphoesterase [Oscillospiraceae bacterium]
MKYFIFILIICFTVFVVYDNCRFVISRYKIKTGVNIKNKITAVHISDIHNKKFGKNNFKLVNSVKKLNPDCIFLTGDIVSRNISDLDGFQQFISGLLKLAPVFYSLGNHEKDVEELDKTLYSSMIKFLKDSGVRLLDNSYIDLNKKIRIYGLTVDQSCYKVRGRYKNLSVTSENDINNRLGTSSDKYNILLAHNPFFYNSYAQWGADLILSGHVHGGIVRLPGLKGILSPERNFFPEYSGGLYTDTFDNRSVTMEVSRGIGKFRLFNPSEIIFLEIY